MSSKTYNLSKEAKAYAMAVLLQDGRESLIAQLEGVGCACYDEESDETLAEAVVESIEANDIEFDFRMPSDRSYQPGNIYSLWLDIEETWV
jgi:hypothetical protein